VPRAPLAAGCLISAFLPVQVFVANPNKPDAVTDILINNKEKLLNFLETFHNEKGTVAERRTALPGQPAAAMPGTDSRKPLPIADEDEQFKEEKAVIIKKISQLGHPAPES
jgi:calcium binding protein 39